MEVVERKKISQAILFEHQVDRGTFFGRVMLVKNSRNDKGEHLEFRGVFSCIIGDKEYRAARMYLPPVAQDSLGMKVAIMVSELAPGASFGGLDFAIELSRRDVDRKTSPVGYVYDSKPLIEAQTTDPLVALRQQLNLALPPAPTPAPTDPVETKKKKG